MGSAHRLRSVYLEGPLKGLMETVVEFDVLEDNGETASSWLCSSVSPPVHRPLCCSVWQTNRAFQNCERKWRLDVLRPSSADQSHLGSWSLIDLRAFRAGLIRNSVNQAQIVMGDQKNPDGTRFKWFDVRSFPSEPPLVVASSGATPDH